MQGFDLSDTLVRINYNSGNIPAAIRNARVLYRPRGRFVILTAQQNSPAIRSAVREMVKVNFPNCEQVYFVSGSESEIISKKAALIKRLNLTDFTDNNRDILAAMKEMNLEAKLWSISNGDRKPY